MIWRKRAFGHIRLRLVSTDLLWQVLGDKARVQDGCGQLWDRPALLPTKQDPHNALAMCFGVC